VGEGELVLTMVSPTTVLRTGIRKPCVVCGLEGIESVVERLPKAGILIQCIHDKDGSKHQWARYDSLNDAGKQPEKPHDPKIIICPKCGKKGRINEYHPYTKRPGVVVYLVTHGYLDGTWGKGNNIIRRRERCYIRNPEHRNIVLGKLGRLIDQSKIVRKRSVDVIIVCPKCEKEGRAVIQQSDLRVYVDHRRNGGMRHYMIIKEDKEKVMKNLLTN
jgi:hypothetical protein